MPPTLRVRRERFVQACWAADLGSHSAIARHLGVSHSTVSRILRGKSSPSAEFVAAATLAFGLSIDALFEAVPAKTTRKRAAA